jgi:hypothetical protein
MKGYFPSLRAQDAVNLSRVLTGTHKESLQPFTSLSLLREAIELVMGHQNMTVPGILDALEARGWLPDKANIYQIIENLLDVNPQFEQPAPGVYRVNFRDDLW